MRAKATSRNQHQTERLLDSTALSFSRGPHYTKSEKVDAGFVPLKASISLNLAMQLWELFTEVHDSRSMRRQKWNRYHPQQNLCSYSARRGNCTTHVEIMTEVIDKWSSTQLSGMD
jgi:hypothetical protein